MKNPSFFTGIIQINYSSSLKTRAFVTIEDSKCQSAIFADSQINNFMQCYLLSQINKLGANARDEFEI
jgi:hypothetical protein